MPKRRSEINRVNGNPPNVDRVHSGIRKSLLKRLGQRRRRNSAVASDDDFAGKIAIALQKNRQGQGQFINRRFVDFVGINSPDIVSPEYF